jgi:hypothetical protein
MAVEQVHRTAENRVEHLLDIETEIGLATRFDEYMSLAQAVGESCAALP